MRSPVGPPEHALTLALPDVVTARESYRAAVPWPHLVLHDVLPADLLSHAEQEVTSTALEHLDDAADNRRQRKKETGADEQLGTATRQVLALLEGPQWRAFLEQVTGVEALLGDPTRFGAGLHSTPTGGFTMVHVDFDEHPTTGLAHRVNTLLYLNSGWQEQWGGSLELWPADMSSVGSRIVPTAGTLVLWETHAGTAHGLPEPVAAPDGRPRCALAIYHYTEQPRADLRSSRATVTYRRRPQDPLWMGLPTVGDLRTTARRWRSRVR